jgi:uncharacterized protein (DUF697 family)
LPSYSANLPERTRNRSRLASNIPHDTLFAPRGVLGRKTSTYRTKCWSRSNIRKGSAMAHKSSASSDTGEAIAADTPETREEMASKLVDRFALWSGVAGLIPVPVVDVFAVGGLQIQMVRRLSQIYDVEFSENRGKALIASLAGSMIPATSGIGAASVLKAVPIIGTIAGGFVPSARRSSSTLPQAGPFSISILRTIVNSSSAKGTCGIRAKIAQPSLLKNPERRRPVRKPRPHTAGVWELIHLPQR